jgi:hypothetical protein
VTVALVPVLLNASSIAWHSWSNISTSGVSEPHAILDYTVSTISVSPFQRLLHCYAAYVYVGLYGYSYLQAGKQVFGLFKSRGWEAIIADDLVGNVLLLVSVIVGGLIGSLAIAIEATSDLFDDAGGNAKLVAFILGFIIGLVVCSIALSTIGSGVNAVVVLFAEAPAEFQQKHPELSNRMRQAWALVYPGSV